MIEYLRGIIRLREQKRVVLDVGGVGYGVAITLAAEQGLPTEGEEAELAVHTQLGDEAIQLFGFADRYERRLFRTLIEVSGIGPRLAMNILSKACAPDVVRAIVAGDHKGLSRLPGVGKKTAERLCLELREKLAGLQTEMAAAGMDGAGQSAWFAQQDDLLLALDALGYKRPQIEVVLRRLRDELPSDTGIERLLEAAIRGLSR